MLKTLRLRSLTYSGTCPDGNCRFNAASQCTSGHVYDTLIQQADRGQDQHAELRQKAVDTLRSSVCIGTGLQDAHTAEYTLGKYPQQLFLYKQNPTDASHFLASAIASPKAWAGTWSIRALAIALHRNFVVINQQNASCIRGMMQSTVEVPRHGPQSSTHGASTPGRATIELICPVRFWRLPHASMFMMGKLTSGQLCVMQSLQPWSRCWQLAWSWRHQLALSKQLFQSDVVDC